MRKPVKEHKSVTGLAFLVESELEKAQVVIAAQSILDKMQKMAEDLAKIEADDIMPMLDSMRLTFGPELTDSFNDITTAKIRQTMEAVKGAKEAITTEVGRLERNINGEMTNDMGMDTPDIGDDETDMDLGDEETDMDLGDEETDMDLEEPEEDKVDFDTAFDSAANASAAGRARKESVERNIKALSESSNPDRLIYATFRRTLTETKDAVRSAHAVASAFAIDFQDVVSIVKEGKTFKDEKGKSERSKDRSEDRKSKKRERPSDLDEDLKPWMRKPEDKDFDKPAFERKAEHEKMAGPPAVKTVKNKTDESTKPDFLDIDKDGDKKEPMKKAAADKKKTPKKGFKTGGVAEGERDATATTRGSSIVDTLEGMIDAFSQREKALEKSKEKRAAKSFSAAKKKVDPIEEAKSLAGAVKLVMAKKTTQKPFKVSNPKITK